MLSLRSILCPPNDLFWRDKMLRKLSMTDEGERISEKLTGFLGRISPVSLLNAAYVLHLL